MRKTTAGRILLAFVNIAFIAFATTAIISSVPPQYNLQIAVLPSSTSSTALTIPVSFNVTNNGFYDINNFYIRMSANGPSGNLLNQTEGPHITIARGTTYTYDIMLGLNLTYVHENPGAYLFELAIHSEFAYGLIKFTVTAPMTQSLSA
jgi:hypothetical protein